MDQKTMTKDDVQANISSYTLRKREVTREYVLRRGTSAIQLFMREIYPVEEGAEIPKGMKPLKGFLCAPGGKVLVKIGSTTNIIGKKKSNTNAKFNKSN